MVYCLWALCLGLTVTVLLLIWKIILLRRSAEAIRQGLQERLETDTNTLLSIPSRDGAMCRLAAGLNAQLRLLRQERRRCQQGDRDLKDAVTNISHDLRTPLTAPSAATWTCWKGRRRAKRRRGMRPPSVTGRTICGG